MPAPEAAPEQPTLRDAAPDDFTELWRIDQACFPPGIAYSRAELAHYIKLRSAFTRIAEIAGEPVGFIVAQKRQLLGHIITIDVLATARGRGIGSLLLQDAEHRLKALGCHSMYLETAVNNAAALAFYKRHDYFVLKTIRGYYNGELDAFLLGKRFA